MGKRTSGFEQIYKKPDEANVRAWIGKEEAVQSKEAAKVKKSIVKSDYSSLYNKFKAKLDVMPNEEVKKLFDYLEATDERPKLSVYCNVVVYLGSCNTHSVVIYVRGSHSIDEILKMPPFSFMEDLEIEERDSFDIKEARSEWLDENYNVVAYFEPYEPDFIGLDNKKGAICGECGDRFQVRLQTKEELLRLYYKSME